MSFASIPSRWRGDGGFDDFVIDDFVIDADDDDDVEEEEDDEDSSYYYGGGGSGGMTVVSVGHRPSLLRYHTHLLEALPLSQSPSRRGGGADDREGQARRFASLRASPTTSANKSAAESTITVGMVNASRMHTEVMSVYW